MAEGQEFGLVQFSRMSRRMVRMMEKSRAHRTLNDAPLPKVNWYLSHVCFIRFSAFSLHLICFSPLHVWNFQNCFLHAGIFPSIFSLFTKRPKIFFWVLKSFGKNNLDIFSSKLLAVHHISKVHNRWRSIWPNGGTRKPTLGPANPTGRPTQDQWLLGPTFSNGYLTIVPGSSSGALAQIPLNRSRERGDELSCSLFPLSLPLTHSCSGFLWILTQVWLQEHSLSHFFAARLITCLEEQLLGKSFIFISLT